MNHLQGNKSRGNEKLMTQYKGHPSQVINTVVLEESIERGNSHSTGGVENSTCSPQMSQQDLGIINGRFQ